MPAENSLAAASIRDTGIGIPAGDNPYILGRFYRVDHARSPESAGTGLNPTIGRSIVGAHQGEICVEDEVFKSSQLRVRLLLVQG